ncbi:hypothetical protein PMG11_07794 [Penicillium brasilianum]|uniref:R3H domain protein n=1 Tax=Penicillium brasilianum TaxID=104259 RepID=A0A0F7TR27_PENBI|nr:hypothetical protein PMG11_07794 [Penicillium brasilianum]
MASQNNNSAGDSHFSFAKIAAMPAPPTPHLPMASNESDSAQPANVAVYSESLDSSALGPGLHNLNTINEQIPLAGASGNDLARVVQEIDLSPHKDRQGSGSSSDDHENGLLKRENSFDDDRTHLSTSSTKMTNFDSKSLASVTTFAMDEKDSVRPDDSASVQAIDEEESLSGAASGAPNSVTGSEAGGRVFRDHFRDNIALRPRGILPAPVPGFNDGNSQGAVIIPPDSVANNFVVPVNPDSPANSPSLHSFPLHPDEKLITAMENPKDRLMVLTIEEKVRAFIEYSSEQSLELPPNNSYGRLLAHRLGDYYHLTHFVDNNVTSVRLHRTPFSRLPTPLSELFPTSNEKPSHPMPTKIMRRADGRPSAEGSVAASSSVPSKAASETDDAGQDGDPTGSAGSMSAKDRMAMTREEREAKYAEVRERIFRDFPETAKSEASGDSTTNMSRSSSTTGRKKNQKQRTPHDDGFEARSQFNPYYPGMQFTNNGSPAYNTSANDGSYAHQVPYMVGPGVAPPSGGYMSAGQNNTMYPAQGGMNNVPQFSAAMSPQVGSTAPWQGGNAPQQSPFPGYSGMNQPAIMGQPTSTKSSPAMNNFPTPHSPQFQQAPGWNQGAFPGNFQQSPHQRPQQHPTPWSNYQAQPMPPNMATYSYAQYPGQHMKSGLHSAGNSAMASNFPRSHFNPQTRSFVPGGAGTQRHPGKGVQHPLQQPYGNRPSAAQPSWPRFPESMPNHSVDHSAAASAARTPSTGSQTSLAKWGTPSHLPPKPPPSEVRSDFDLKHRTGSTSLPTPTVASNGIPSAAKNGPLVVSGGTTASKMN